MRHAKRRTRLSLTTSERKALIMSQCRAIFEYQRITTTHSKAKLTRPFVEKIITLAKTDTLQNRRRVFRTLNDHVMVKRVFEKIAPLFEANNGGYTRILRLKRRRGDNALLAIFELVNRLPEEKRVVKDKEKEEQKPVAAEDIKPAEIKPEEKSKLKLKLKDKPQPKKVEPSPKAKEEKEVKKMPEPKPPLKEKEKKLPEKKRGKFLGGIGRLFKRKQKP